MQKLGWMFWSNVGISRIENIAASIMRTQTPLAKFLGLCNNDDSCLSYFNNKERKEVMMVK